MHITGVMKSMAFASSKLTAQGQISVPAEIRRKLGLAPGSVLEWDEQGDEVVVRRAGKYTSEEVCSALFPGKAPRTRTLTELKAGVREAVRKRHARR
jgi:antitoxin PrlF